MPRNSNGIYSLPSAPFVPGTVISSSAVNSDFSDIANALTGSIAANGTTAITGQLRSSIIAAPAYTSSLDITTGFGVSASGTAAIYVGNTTVATFTSAAATIGLPLTVNGNTIINGTLTASSISFGGTGAIQIPSGTTPQRPASPVQGDIRYNSTNSNFEGYDGTEWDPMSQLNSSYEFSASVATGVLTINFLNTLTGAAPTVVDPVVVKIQNGQGALSPFIINSALSISTNAVGATLGTTNNQAFRFWIVLFATSSLSTPVLGLINCSTATEIFQLLETKVYSATGISAAATSAGVFYCPNGVTVTAQPVKILGYLEYSSGLATAGTYSSIPSTMIVDTGNTPKPGQIIQTISAVQSTSVNAQTSQTQTNVTASISLSSSVNLVRISTAVTGQNASGQSGTIQLSRGTGPTLFGMTASQGGGVVSASNISGTLTLFGYDRPNTFSATSYYVYATSTVNNGYACGTSSFIELTELMG